MSTHPPLAGRRGILAAAGLGLATALVLSSGPAARALPPAASAEAPTITAAVKQPATTTTQTPAQRAAADAAASTAQQELSTDPADWKAGTYIVQFAAKPASTYTGGVRGFAATQPRSGAKLDVASAGVTSYRARVVSGQRTALSRVGAKATQSYSIAFNGATAHLSAKQAAQLAGSSDVVSITEDALQHVDAATTPASFLKMPALWKSAGGQANAGKGIVVGVIDTGIWAKNAAFTATKGQQAPKGWKGTCEAGEDNSFKAAYCNGKIIGARYYVTGFGAGNIADDEYLSPLDGEGHGTHTSSTAAGNLVKNVVIDGRSFGQFSGMAPGANIAAYKACWSGSAASGCASSDLLAAIDDAVSDGVDVINYSIGTSIESPLWSPTEIAFLNAAAAGVFVSASAGNSGPDASTLDHPSPWLTTVAASTYTANEKKLVLGDGTSYVGASTTDSLATPTAMVDASTAAAAGVSAKSARLCAADSLDPVKITGKLVVCIRGTVARTEKSIEVKRAGGVGMVLINPADLGVNADLHALPTVHLESSALDPVLAYVAAGGATGSIVPLAAGESKAQTPQVASFSSRGASLYNPDTIKPDISAPGVDVLAGIAPDQDHGRNFDLLSGTSMAAPHIAGIAAVLAQVHPTWSPMAIKSAMMTTAESTKVTTSPFDQGAGNVRPTKADQPLVVFDSSLTDWLGYLEHDGWITPVPGVTSISATQLNGASIADHDVVGKVVVTRTLTSVSAKTETFTFTGSVPGFKVTTNRPTVTLKPGRKVTVKVGFTRTDAALNTWATGSVSFVSSNGTVRLPVALQASASRANPTDVTASRTDGSAGFTVRSGQAGTLVAKVQGLQGTTPVEGAVTAFATGSPEPGSPEIGTSAQVYDLNVSDTTTFGRIALDAHAADADLDVLLYRYEPDLEGWALAGGSAVTGTGHESYTYRVLADANPGFDPSNPVPWHLSPGAYKVVVNGVSGSTDGSYALRTWQLNGTDTGNLAVTPLRRLVSAGENTTVTLRWSTLSTKQDYFGRVSYTIGADSAFAFLQVN